MALLNVNSLKKVYTTRLGGAKVQALSGVSFTVEEGEFVAIMGESGSGKTTLLNILAGLDKPTSGQVFLNMRDIVSLNEKEISAFRRDHLGFVFQDFNLLDTFSLQDNIFLPLVLAGKKYDEMKKRIDPIAHPLGIWELLRVSYCNGKEAEVRRDEKAHRPHRPPAGRLGAAAKVPLRGLRRPARAAIARAIITYPELILADEPTGALDSRSAGQILDIFADVNRSGQTILMVTHSVQAACRAGRVLFIKDGQVYHQIYRGAMTDDELYQAISRTLTELATSRERSVAVHG